MAISSFPPSSLTSVVETIVAYWLVGSLCLDARAVHSTAASYLDFGTLQFSGSLGVLMLACTRLSPD
jgi:uncharacterized membrane protein YgdD (TMEM256/DUF423 family)